MKKATPIFIINLPKSLERRNFIAHQFNLLNSQVKNPINYQFFEAINGKETPDFYLFQKYNEKERFKRKGNTMNLSQLGCFASHYLLWQKCIELDQGIIILEDDAIIHKEFINAYEFIDSEENIFEFFWLSPPAPARRNQKSKMVYSINNSKFNISEFYKGWGNTTGYYLTPKAAKKLIDYTQEWIYEVDITMERYWENKLDFLALVPFCIEPNFDMESNIPVDKGSKNRTLKTTIRRESYKLLDNLNKLIYLILINR